MPKTATPSTITVEVEVLAPVEKVWKLWTTAKDIQNWCHASDDWGVTNATNDLRVGGDFKTVMAAKDGSTSFDFVGTYTHVTPLKIIAYTIADARKVRVTFERLAHGTYIAETFEPENENSAEAQRVGWQAILNNFKKYAEKK